jgi:hypothetical protein
VSLRAYRVYILGDRGKVTGKDRSLRQMSYARNAPTLSTRLRWGQGVYWEGTSNQPRAAVFVPIQRSGAALGGDAKTKAAPTGPLPIAPAQNRKRCPGK